MDNSLFWQPLASARVPYPGQREAGTPSSILANSALSLSCGNALQYPSKHDITPFLVEGPGMYSKRREDPELAGLL